MLISKKRLGFLTKLLVLTSLILLSACEEGTTTNHFLTVPGVQEGVNVTFANVTADFYFGDGSQLTNLPSGGGFTNGSTIQVNDLYVQDDIFLTDDLNINGRLYWEVPGLGFNPDYIYFEGGAFGQFTLESYYEDAFATPYALRFVVRPDLNQFQFTTPTGGSPDFCTGATCGTIAEFLDDNPEAGDVLWSDLTDQGTFTDGKFCTYASGTGYISCTSDGGSGGFTTDQNNALNTTKKPTFGGVYLNDSNGGTTSLLDINDQLTLSGNDFGTNNHNIVDVDFDYVAGSNIAINTINGLNVNMKYSGSGLVSNSGKLANFVLDGNSDATLPDQPFKITVQNVKSGQAFGEGVFSIDAYGSGGANIAAFTRMRVTGSGDGIGYKGYATNSGTLTGSLIGVQGYAAAVTGTSGATAAVGLDGVVIGGGTNVPYNKTMGVRSNAHVLVQGTRASLIVSGAADTTPAGVPTDHLNFKDNTGELYVKNTIEADGAVYLDNLASTGSNAGSAVCIDANNRLCPCGSCA